MNHNETPVISNLEDMTPEMLAELNNGEEDGAE